MKQFSVLYPGRSPIRGYVGRCPNCGDSVVKSVKTGEPFHMHRRSKKCRENRKRRLRQVKIALSVEARRK